MDRRRFLTSSLAGAVAVSLPTSRLLALTRVTDEIEAATGTGVATTIERSALQELRDALRGAVLLPGDPGYDVARKVLNESIDKHPALIVQPTGVADIRTAVDFARERNLLLAVKCGGHSYSGRSTCDRGLQIDLSRFRSVRIDPVARIARVAGGSLLGELDHESMAFGLVTTAGTVSHTGVSGLTLGGGFGRLARRFGLALDNVRSVDIVTADGQLLHASADEHPDLYWGVRGGGGNFGIVTSFHFELHPMQRQVIGGNVVYPISRARELLEFYGDFCLTASEELYADAFMQAPARGADGVFGIHVCYSGAPDDADKALAPLRKLGTPLMDTVQPVDYVVLQRSSDQTDPRNEGEYLKSGFLNDYGRDLVTAMVDGFEPHPDRGTTLFFQHSGAAIGRVAADATAFPHRRSRLNLFVAVSWPLALDPAPHIGYLRNYWRTLEPFTDGYYTNEVGDEGQSRIDANYQGNLPRLRKVKARYDPGNLFRLNANIEPARS